MISSSSAQLKSCQDVSSIMQNLNHRSVCHRAALMPARAAMRPERSNADLGRVSARKNTDSGPQPSAVSVTATEFLTSTSQFVGFGPNPTHTGRVPRKTKPRLRVAVDVDEVLGRFLHSLNQFCFDEYGLEYDISDYFVYDFAKVWRCSQEESNHKVHEFFKSYHFSAGIEVIPGSKESLVRLRETCDLVVVTSRQHVIQTPTIEWIHDHFPEIFKEVHFGNHFALEGASRKKSEICKSVGAHVLIDDNPNYAMECAEAGLHVLLYDWQHNYPWSKTECGPSHANITRVRDWEEVEHALAALGAVAAANASEE